MSSPDNLELLQAGQTVKTDGTTHAMHRVDELFKRADEASFLFNKDGAMHWLASLQALQRIIEPLMNDEEKKLLQPFILHELRTASNIDSFGIFTINRKPLNDLQRELWYWANKKGLGMQARIDHAKAGDLY